MPVLWYLGMNNKKLLLAYLIFLAGMPPLATDMYLPALPTMVDQFQSSVGIVNLTLVLFFVFFSASILLWGTLSDKYGRKPILIISAIIFTASSFLCSLSMNVYQLIIFRILQAIGAGATVSVSMAVMKDAFEGTKRARALAISSVFSVIAPITAPIIGAGILSFLSWRWIFIFLGGAGIVSLAGALIMKETSEKNKEKSVLQTIANLFRVLKTPGFSWPLPLFAMLGCPIFFYIGASAEIFIKGFGMSEKAYSLFFGANAAFSALGSSLYLIISRRLNTTQVINLSFFLLLISGIMIIITGDKGPFLFAATMLPGTIAATLIRPPSSNLLLEQVDEDAGAASSMMMFSYAFAGSIGMQFISLGWANRISVIGIVHAATGVAGFLSWPLLYKKCKKLGY